MSMTPSGSHSKYIADALKSPKNVKFDETGENVVEGMEPEE
jgi:acyl-coenzyme A thioesterase 13